MLACGVIYTGASIEYNVYDPSRGKNEAIESGNEKSPEIMLMKEWIV